MLYSILYSLYYISHYIIYYILYILYIILYIDSNSILMWSPKKKEEKSLLTYHPFNDLLIYLWG